MFILDFLADWGVYAPVLFGLWLAAAYGIAGRRARRRLQTAKQLSWVLGNMISIGGLTYLIFPGLLFYSAVDSSISIILVFWWLLLIFYPLLLIRTDMRRFEIGQSLGYAHLRDMLLFRAPVAEQSADTLEPPPSPATERRIKRSTYLLVLSVTGLLTVISFISVSLRSCNWLDIIAHRSGCILSIATDDLLVQDVVFSPDGSTLAVASSWRLDMSARLYRVSDGALIRKFEPAGTNLSFSPDGSLLASATGAYTVSVWDAHTGGLIYNLQTPSADTAEFWPETVGFSPDGKYLAVGSDKQGIQLWRKDDWALERTLPAQSGFFSFSPDGAVIAGEFLSRTVALWRTDDGTVLRTLPASRFIDGLAYSSDGTKIVLISSVGPAEIWDALEGKSVYMFPTTYPERVVFSHSGQLLLVSGESPDDSLHPYVRLQRLQDWPPNAARLAITEYLSIDEMAFSPDDQLFAYAAWETVKVWQTPQQ